MKVKFQTIKVWIQDGWIWDEISYPFFQHVFFYKAKGGNFFMLWNEFQGMFFICLRFPHPWIYPLNISNFQVEKNISRWLPIPSAHRWISACHFLRFLWQNLGTQPSWPSTIIFPLTIRYPISTHHLPSSPFLIIFPSYSLPAIHQHPSHSLLTVKPSAPNLTLIMFSAYRLISALALSAVSQLNYISANTNEHQLFHHTFLIHPPSSASSEF